MIMLKEYTSPEDLQEALNLSGTVPELLFVHCCIHNFLSRAYPCSDIRAFSYPFSKPLYWFLVDLQKNSMPKIHVAQSAEVHDSHIFLTGLKLFLEEIKTVSQFSNFEIGTESHLLHDIQSVLPQYFEGMESGTHVEHNLFYMTPEQMDNTNKVVVTVPHGYELSQILAEEAGIIKNTAVQNESVDQVRSRIQHLPSICVRLSNSGALVTHELTSNYGNMSHLYTAPDHRRNGLASAAEIGLAQKIISQAGIPFKVVPTYLTSIILSSEDSPFWTVWTRHTIPVQFVVQNIELSSA